MIRSLNEARAVIRRNVTGELVGTPELAEACAYVDGWCDEEMPYCVDPELWNAWLRGRAEADSTGEPSEVCA